MHNLSLLCLLLPLYPVPPDIRDNGLLSNVSVVMNQPTNLVCDVTGTPVPVITWYKDEVEVSAMTFTENHMVLFCVITACNLERKMYKDKKIFASEATFLLPYPKTVVLTKDL